MSKTANLLYVNTTFYASSDAMTQLDSRSHDTSPITVITISYHILTGVAQMVTCTLQVCKGAWLLNSAAKMWNDLPADSTDFSSLNSFKRPHFEIFS